MKKRISVLLAALMAVSMFAGCGEEKSGNLKDIAVEKYVEFTEDYVGMPLILPAKVEVTQADIDTVAWNTYMSSITAETGGIVDREVAMGDMVNIDYEGKRDGVAFEGGTAKAQSLVIGSGSFIEGFEAGLVGVNPGETVDLNLTFPAEYKNNPDLAGAAVVFTVTVNFIYPEGEGMQDDVIAAITEGEFTTVDTFVEFCSDYLTRQVEYSYDMELENAVVTSLEAVTEVKKVPKALVEKYEATIRKNIEAQAAQYGVELDVYCIQNFYMDAETYVKAAAETSAEQGLIFQYIANKENLNISDEELDTMLQQYVTDNGWESVDAVLANYSKEEFRELFVFERVVDFIVANGIVTEY